MGLSTSSVLPASPQYFLWFPLLLCGFFQFEASTVVNLEVKNIILSEKSLRPLLDVIKVLERESAACKKCVETNRHPDKWEIKLVLNENVEDNTNSETEGEVSETKKIIIRVSILERNN